MQVGPVGAMTNGTLSAARSIAAYRFSSSLTALTAPLRSV